MFSGIQPDMALQLAASASAEAAGTMDSTAYYKSFAEFLWEEGDVSFGPPHFCSAKQRTHEPAKS